MASRSRSAVSRWLPASFAIGLAMALFAWVCSLTSMAYRFDNRYGLGILYGLRGPIEPPQNAVVVAVDRATITWLRELNDGPSHGAAALLSCLPARVREELSRIRGPETLPRSVHACLVRHLEEAGFPVVAFDVLFSVAGDEDDELLATTMREHGAVALLSGLERSTIEEHQVQPLALLVQNAAAVGTFIVSRTAGPVYGYWRSFPRFEGMRSLPDVVHRLYGATSADAAANGTDGSGFEYFWLYGPPGSITTLSARDVLAGEIPAGLLTAAPTSVAFVGASDPNLANFPDTFPSFFDSPTGAQISGVELAATAFLNLAADQRLRRLSPAAETLVVVSFAFLLGFLVRLPGGYGMLVPPSAAILYLGAAAFVFVSAWIFLPLIVPVFFVAPVAFVLAGLARLKFLIEFIKSVVQDRVFKTIGKKSTVERMTPVPDDATVVHFDLANSTAFAENMPLDAFTALLGRYHEAVQAAVDRNRGVVIDFIGDGVEAAFIRSDAGTDHAEHACNAAIAVIREVRAMNALNEAASRPLLLRVGLNSGGVILTQVGAPNLLRLAVTGDVVHVAKRLEEMGKTLFPSESVILVGESTRGLAQRSDLNFFDCGEQEIRGRERRAHVYRLAED